MWFLLFDRQTQDKKTAQRGFTLIEILLVILLIGVISVAAINAFEGNEDEARYNLTKLELAELQKALLIFRKDNREMPCLVYVSEPQKFTPFLPDFSTDMSRLDFSSDETTVPATPDSYESYAQWCSESLKNSDNEDVIQNDNALSILNKFPFPLNSDNGDLLWNQDTQTGWNGPYISEEGLTDGWGNPYKLLDPELAHEQRFRCADNGSGQYDLTGDTYDCLPAQQIPSAGDYPLAGNIVRIASHGPDGIFESATKDYILPAEDPCVPKGDDLVRCLLR